MPGDSCGLVRRAGKRGLREEGGWLRNTRWPVFLRFAEVSQQARRFAPVEGDREAALCQGTGWDHETREDPPVPEGWVGKGVLAFSFHEGRTRHREGQPFIQETQQLGRPMVNRLHPYLGFLPRLPGEEEGAAECPDLSLPCPRLRCKFGKSVPSLPPTQGL